MTTGNPAAAPNPSATGGRLSEVKVLMIEDDAFLSELVLNKLSSEGCVPFSANTGDQAVSLAEQHQPHVIILDLMLPGVQGEEVLKKLKNDENLKTIPVIIFSNKSEATDIEVNTESGAAAFLIKSQTQLNEIVNTIAGILGKS